MPNLAATETSGAVSSRTRVISLALFFLIIACGIVYVGIHLSADLSPVKESSVLPFLLLIVALLIALGAVVVAQLGLWQYARIEGGVLPPLDYLAEVFGPLVPGQLLVAAIAARIGAR